MYIQNKNVSAFYKLSLGLIAVYGFWMTLVAFGMTAWRLFSTWAFFIGAIYFCVSALILALSSKKSAGYAPCPMLEGMLIVALLTQAVAAIICVINDEYLPGLDGFAAALTYYILPVLSLLDWCLFNKKGLWRATDPFHWLALPLSYAAMVILTANLLPSSASLRYPVTFLDYNAHGFWEMLSWLALYGLLILIFGYVLVLIDAFMGGTIARHIVLPHIRTVAIDNEDQSSVDDAQSQSSQSARSSQPPEPSHSPQSETSRMKAEFRTSAAHDFQSTQDIRTSTGPHFQPVQDIRKSPTQDPRTVKSPQNSAARGQSARQNVQSSAASKTTKSYQSSRNRPKSKRKINDVAKPKSET